MTLIASLRPAIRATRVPPIAAVREGSVLPPPKHRRLRGAGAVVMAAAGILAISYGIFAHGLGTKQVLIWMGLGTLLMFLGVSLFSSRLVRPLAGVIGWPATKAAGAAGLLARDNTRRNPQRTASTAAALMIGLDAGDARRDARVGPHRVVHEGRGRSVRRRLCDHGPEQLLADSHRRRRGRGQSAGRDGDRERADRRSPVSAKATNSRPLWIQARPT